MTKITTKFPDAELPLNMSVDMRVPKQLGLTAKIFIQEKARTLPLYNQAIKCDGEGQSVDGKKIQIDTIGRWLFGVPGYVGHIRIVPVEKQVLLHYPKDSPKVVHELIALLKEAVETNQ